MIEQELSKIFVKQHGYFENKEELRIHSERSASYNS
jgi:hypothetical protein